MNPVTLDSYDHAILAALSADATRTNADLSSIVHLSASQCSRRRSRLERDGVITGYAARLDPDKLGFGLRAVTRVNLARHGERHADDFARFLQRHDEVRSAWSVSGDADYVLVILTRDLAGFASFIHRHLLPHPDVAQVRSEIVLTTLKDMP